MGTLPIGLPLLIWVHSAHSQGIVDMNGATHPRRHDLLRMRGETEESGSVGKQRDKDGREYDDGDDGIMG